VLSATRIRTLAVGAVVAGGLVLVAPHAPSAFAAGGTFSYTAADGKSRTSANPPSQMCLKVTGSGMIKNMTDESVSLFKTPDCADAGRITTVDSKSSKQNVATFQSLMWDDPNADGGADSDSGSDDGDSGDDSGGN
jgi:hypothetical protein